MSTVPVRRVRWRPKFSVVGIGGGVLAAIGLLVVLQQRGLVFPTTVVGIVALLGGIAFGIAVPSLARLVAVRRINRALAARAEARAAAGSAAPAEVPPAEVPPPAPAGIVGDEPPPPPPPPPAERETSAPAPKPARTRRPAAWAPTHRVPVTGMPAWEAPDPATAPAAQLDPGLEVKLLGVEDGWGHIVCSNGWQAWVESRNLEELD